mmetsp:Transcript_48939/g.153694  ORF Transcript_48939/g.153694 Transcript_48939/m.153694 type:complete len:118 (-) Transcript_48939:1127-1480(-)
MRVMSNDSIITTQSSSEHTTQNQQPTAAAVGWDFDAFSEPPSHLESELQNIDLARCTSDSAVEKRRSSWLPPDVQKLVSVFTCREVLDIEDMFAEKPASEKSLLEPEDSKQFTQVLA